ncbi:bifunctional DNA primase/polymerase [uncultured Bartonella sp.]|uniref:bifunctional DNA primase/polymerase n=1 Tax=uncultured Bartonella sp. TaxID=104108 RepID=UPI0025E0EAE9|nr:bifunctional DNA primase/polymerase [uncultured Bartonella sp.]
MTGIFADWQPRYAEIGIATFPVWITQSAKRPAVKRYLNVGKIGSEQLALKFPDIQAFGIACKKNRLTVLDVDTSDERILAEELDKYGKTPFIVRSGSGHFQAWYRNNGEGRRIRPNNLRPVDILGDGYVVAPPSKGIKGNYQIIAGSLDDLHDLPKMRSVGVMSDIVPKEEKQKATLKIGEGQRNDLLWRHCMRAVPSCQSLDELMSIAAKYNQSEFCPPLPDDEVTKLVNSAFQHQLEDKNYFATGHKVIIDHSMIDGLMMEAPDAFLLYNLLKRFHWGREFYIADAMAPTMPKGGWTQKRLSAARKELLNRGIVKRIKKASSSSGAAIYKFQTSQK